MSWRLVGIVTVAAGIYALSIAVLVVRTAFQRLGAVWPHAGLVSSLSTVAMGMAAIVATVFGVAAIIAPIDRWPQWLVALLYGMTLSVFVLVGAFVALYVFEWARYGSPRRAPRER